MKIKSKKRNVQESEKGIKEVIMRYFSTIPSNYSKRLASSTSIKIRNLGVAILDTLFKTSAIIKLNLEKRINHILV